MNTWNKVGFACNAFAIISSAIFGAVYLLSPQFMPYHGVMLGRSWAEIDPALQVLILAMMRVIGSAQIIGALVALTLLVIPWRRGESWARWTVFLSALGVAGYIVAVGLYVTAHTPSGPPWQAAVVGAILVVIGFIFAPAPDEFIEDRQRARRLSHLH
jgi:ABC-type Fe3+ transport system permease subunit